MASLRRLPLPEPDSGRSGKDDIGARTGEGCGMGERGAFGFEQASADSRRSCSVAPGAIAHGCAVLGLRGGGGEGDGGDGDGDGGGWVGWEATFAPHRVCRVASNGGGTVVVASTAGGEVSLMRAADGAVLATRRVHSAGDDDEASSLPAEVAFAAGADRNGSVVGDVLVILVPPGDPAADEPGAPPPPGTAGGAPPQVSAILVSGIDGARLNGSDPEEVARAKGDLSIDALTLSLPGGGDSAVTSLNACFVDEATVRFLAVDGAGRLSAHDYDVRTKEASRAADVAPNLEGLGEGWTVDGAVGVRVDDHHGMFLLAATRGGTSRLCLLDARDLTLRGEHTMKDPGGMVPPRLFSVEAVASCDEDAAALAVAYRPSSSGAEACIDVVQLLVGRDRTPSATHLVYRIPVAPRNSEGIRWVDVSPLQRHANGTYAMGYKVSYNCGIGEFMEFQGEEGGVVGSFRLSLERGLFDEADSILTSSAALGVASNEFGSIHGSEVALHRFRAVLGGGDMSSPGTMTDAKECLRRLSAGAVTGGDRGVRCLLDASTMLLEWPSAITQGGGSRKILAREYRGALMAMSATIAGSLEAAPTAHVSTLQDEKDKIDRKITAMKCLENLYSSQESKEVAICPQMAGVASPVDVFCVLVGQGRFVAAEELRTSHFGNVIAPEYIALSIVRTRSGTNAIACCNWLEDVVIPGLTINHPMLAAIRSWACKVADSYDDEVNGPIGCDNSIRLLKTVAEATAKLSATTHKPFSSISRFESVGNEPKSLQQRGAQSNAIRKLPAPTVMKLGLLRGGGRKKGTTSFMALRAHRGKAPAATSRTERSIRENNACDAELLKIFSQFEEDMEGESELVEKKLLQALHLSEARTLGLPKRIISLSSYEQSGGSTFVAKELVRLSPSNYKKSSHSKEEYITGQIIPFCKRADVAFDKVLLVYTKELCEHNHNDPDALLEAASLASFCLEDTIRCSIALRVLRSALLCSELPPALSEISKEAMDCAIDEGIRSELEESSRLLVVDRIVRRYCGNGAQELFHVSDPRHGLKLLQYVCRHVDEWSALDDALILCDAFTHLSKIDACVLFLKRVSLAPVPKGSPPHCTSRAEQCSGIIRDLCSRDPVLAEKVGEEACLFFAEVVQDGGPMFGKASSEVKRRMQNDSKAATNAAIAIIGVLQENIPKSTRTHWKRISILKGAGAGCWTSLLHQFRCLQTFQADYSVFLSLSDLANNYEMRDQVARRLLGPSIEIIDNLNGKINLSMELKDALGHARRGIDLFFSDDRKALSYWSLMICAYSVHLILVGSNDAYGTLLLNASGLLDDLAVESAFDVVYPVVVAYCIRASKETSAYAGIDSEDDVLNDTENSIMFAMRCIVRAASLLEERGLQLCTDRLLPTILSLTSLTQSVSQVLDKGDGGYGERISEFQLELHEGGRKRKAYAPQVIERHAHKFKKTNNLSTPSLHDWYVGDGLLLPPVQSLSHVTSYCRKLMNCVHSMHEIRNPNTENKVYQFLDSRGAHTISLRLRAHSFSEEMAVEDSGEDASFDEILAEQMKCLAQRSLGGSGTGITSGSIDSQLAFSYLLSLPQTKTAFEVYRACLPSAVSRRDFSRIKTLAHVGLRAGDGGSDSIVKSSRGNVVSWQNQSVFVAQCHRLKINSSWWNVLQRFGISFDPKRFDSKDNSQRNEYIVSLVLPLVGSACKALLRASVSLERVLQLAAKFVEAYGLERELAAQKFVEFLLSSPTGDDTTGDFSGMNTGTRGKHVDVRKDIEVCKKAVKESLVLLPSPMARAALVRRCLIALEGDETCYRDYGRYISVVSLYLDELSLVLADKSNSDYAEFQNEFDRIDRRHDALLILSSFFREGGQAEDRPPFPKLFLPLTYPFKSDKGERLCGILGHNSAHSSPKDFDPLLPLIPTLCADSGASSVPALSPLCVSLGLPPGYIHARSLYLRFEKANAAGSTLPSFENSVRPVINRIKVLSDATELCEYCSMRYEDNTKERLSGLELSLSLAMRASSEAEQLARIHKGVKDYREKEQLALNAFKRIGTLKAALADRAKVQSILAKGVSASNSPTSHVSLILTRLIQRVSEKHPDTNYIAPEVFVETLLLEASDKTAQATLDSGLNFTMDDFRQIAVTVHEACKGLAELYSHVNVGAISRKLARRMLVHGEGGTSSMMENTTTSSKDMESSKDQTVVESSTLLSPHDHRSILTEGNDSGSYVMDLNDLGPGGDVFSDDVGCNNPTDIGSTSDVILDEEPSSLTLDGCKREVYEQRNNTVALRAAFVISYAEGYHSHKQIDTENEETSSICSVRPTRTPITSSKLKRGLSKRAGSRDRDGSGRGNAVLDHAKELLGIAFAKKSIFRGKRQDVVDSQLSEMSYSARNISTDLDDSSASYLKESISQEGNIHSFAMRYRALRVAKILCPEEALLLVIRTENYNGKEVVDLEKARFASFVASEIEAMGLELPSSDLVHLSTMSFSSYARALWRNHGHKAEGRLLLLMFELCLKNRTASGVDCNFLLSIVNEVGKKQLPRSLLRCLELLSFSDSGQVLKSIKSLEHGQESVENAVKRVAALIFDGLRRCSRPTEQVAINCIETIQRLRDVITTLSHQYLPLFVDTLCRIAANSEMDVLKEKLVKIAGSAACSLNAGGDRVKAFGTVCAVGGRRDISLRSNPVSNAAAENDHVHEINFERDLKLAIQGELNEAPHAQKKRKLN